MAGITMPEQRRLHAERQQIDTRQKSPRMGRDPNPRAELRPWREFAKGAGIMLSAIGVGVILWIALSGSGWVRFCSPLDIVRFTGCY